MFNQYLKEVGWLLNREFNSRIDNALLEFEFPKTLHVEEALNKLLKLTTDKITEYTSHRQIILINIDGYLKACCLLHYPNMRTDDADGKRLKSDNLYLFNSYIKEAIEVLKLQRIVM